HGLVLPDARQLHPGELRPAAGDVEQALPVTAREPYDALGAHHVARQPADEALEAGLVERVVGAVHEARESVGVQVRTPPDAGALAEGRDAGGEEHVALDASSPRAEPFRAGVLACEPALDTRRRRIVDQIDLVEHQKIGARDLPRGDFRLAELTRRV